MSRLPGLDLLRAIAIISVMFFHASILGLGSPAPAITRYGWMGVDLFFVLSGFLIGSQWFSMLSGLQPNTPGLALQQFYLKRALRILPAYLLVVLIYFLLPAWRETPEIQPWWQFMTFSENLLIDFSHPKAFSHVWSLCVEEHFYLLFPLLAWLLLRKPSLQKTITVAVCVMVAGMIWRGHIWFQHLAMLDPDDGTGAIFKVYYEQIYYPSWTRLDGLLVGVLLAVVKTYRPFAWQALMKQGYWLLMGGLLLLAISVMLFDNNMRALPTIVGYPLLAIGLGFIVASSASGYCWHGRTRIAGAAMMATLAYSLYLSHKLVLHYIKLNYASGQIEQGWLQLIIAASAVLIVGALLYAGIERPFLLWRERLLQSGSKTELEPVSVLASVTE